MPTPTWGNHGNIFKDSGMEVASYRYFDKSTNGLDFKGMLEDLKVIMRSDIFRKYLMNQLYCYMLVRTIQLVLILHMNNGYK